MIVVVSVEGLLDLCAETFHVFSGHCHCLVPEKLLRVLVYLVFRLLDSAESDNEGFLPYILWTRTYTLIW